MLSSLELREYLSATLIAKGSGSACLIFQPITPLLGVCNTLLLLIMNRHSAKKSGAAGFAGEFVALIVYHNSALGGAAGSNQDNAKKNYSAHRNTYVLVAVWGAPSQTFAEAAQVSRIPRPLTRAISRNFLTDNSLFRTTRFRSAPPDV
jgi:hypothetical protein